MSKYGELQTQYSDAEALVECLAELGLPAEVHETAVHLEGYEGSRRHETAEIVVTRRTIGGASNDLGFKLDAETGTYRMIVSEFDSRHRINPRLQNQLRDLYSEKVNVKRMESMGFRLMCRNVEDGKVRLSFGR